MILGIDRLGGVLKQQYDKVIALLVLLMLVLSLVYLGVKVGHIRQMKADFDTWLHTQTPKHPKVPVVEPETYNLALQSLTSPFVITLPVYTNGCGSLFVPETRFSCPDCRMPVKMGTKSCPFCHTNIVYQKRQNPDPDDDGMPTQWEETYKLDPFDPSDALKDNDGDGYSNLVEYRENTNPLDPKSHPAAIERVRLVSITGKKFGLRFQSRIKTKSGYKYGLNYRLPSGEIKTDFVKIGDKVAGVTVKGYKEKKDKVHKNTLNKDISELTVVTDDGEPIVLVIHKATLHTKLVAHLVLPGKDGSQKKFDVSKNGKINLEDAVYKVIDIDGDKKLVVLQPESGQKRIVIRQGAKSSSSSR